RLVGLLVQEKVEAAEVRQRHLARFQQQVLDVDARGEPTQREEQREAEKPPELEVHHSATAGGREARSYAPARARNSRFSATISRLWRSSRPMHASTPSTAPTAKNTSNASTSGTCHCWSR